MMNYEKLARAYRPRVIRVLLIAEAPPPNGKRYFYSPPVNYKPVGTIEKDKGLPSTIFNHYFGQRPSNTAEYSQYLAHLKNHGIFLIDIYPHPEKFRDNKENWYKLFAESNMSRLRLKVNQLSNRDTEVIFLLARGYGASNLRLLNQHFPSAQYTRWKEFRMDTTETLTV